MLPIKGILIRSISGFVFAVPALVLYFACLKRVGKKQNLLRISVVFLFCYYVFGILTVTGIGYTKLRHFLPQIVITPFLGMIGSPVDTLLNVVLFMPLGVFLPLLYRKFRHITSTALTGFLISLTVELVQMFDWGTTDVNDLITNTVGACLGYWIYHLLTGVVHKDVQGSLQVDRVSGTVEVLLVVVYAFVIMVAVQPWFIHDIIGLT